ncbi:hypothetical protein N7495_005719 [Penicillium taxi]|uniref:uncharacterized protein n=1 Tax=Penicillium taxi TaxID=168475 RepID=UPI0025451F72|nr:uncharacterized protein N7495_005719 [Penicillium taxi]KAJ5894028.1 hypothetical protein N7495_005719 [Penicillium taxi]
MGHSVEISDSFGNYFVNDTKIHDPYASVLNIEDVGIHPAQHSQVQLFDSEPSNGQKWKLGLREWLILICIGILTMMDAFDSTVLITMLPHLANTFDKSLVSTFWTNTVYLVLNAGSFLYFTIMCEVFSHGVLWIIACVFTTIGTGICSGSLTLVELIVGRMIQGIGGGGVLALSFVIMAESIPEAMHSRYSCFIMLMRLIGFILGPILGSILSNTARWTWAFYINFIFCGFGMMAIPFAVDMRISKQIPLRKLRVLDWSGVTMAFLGPGCMLLGLSWGGVSYRWNQWETVMPIAVGGAVLLSLAFYEVIWALHPQFDRRLLRTRAITMTYLGCFLHGFVVFCQLQFFPLYLMTTKYLSQTLSGLSLLAVNGFATIPLILISVILAGKAHKQWIKWIIPGGWAITILAGGCSIALSPKTPIAGWIILFLTAGLGHGLLIAGYNIRVHSCSCILGEDSEEDVPMSTKPITFALFMWAWGMAFAVPIGSVVFLNIFGKELRQMGLDRNFINSSSGYLVLMSQVEMSDDQREAIKFASSLALRVVWEVIMGVAVLGCISSAFIE